MSNILIINANDKNLYSFQKLLENEYQITTAISGEHGLKCLLEKDFALILLDIQMPGLNGFEIAHLIKSREKTANIPIIFISANYQVEDFIKQGFSLGAVDYIARPVEPFLLKNKVKVFLKLYQQQKEIRELNRKLEAQIQQQSDALQESETRFKSIVENLSDCVWETDAEGKILYYSDNMRNILGYELHEITGKKRYDLMRTDEAEKLKNILNNKLFSRRTIPNVVNWIKTKNGDEICLQTTWIPVFNSNGNLTGYRGVDSDITELVKTETALENERIKGRFNEKMVALGEMAAGVAHEINNPLTIIIGKTGQLNDLINQLKIQPEHSEKLHKQSASIERMAQRIARIIRGLRNFSRDGTNDPFLKSKVQEIFDDVLPLCEQRFKNHDVVVTISEIPPDLMIECRVTQLSQVLLNLLSNSYDAITHPKEKWIKIEVKDLGNAVEFSVTDSGSGVPGTLHEKIFHPFFTTKEVGKGTGLGLSIAKGIIENHQGNIWIDSNTSNTCFKFQIPKMRSKVQPNTSNKAA